MPISLLIKKISNYATAMNPEIFKEIIRNFQLEPLPEYTTRTLDTHEIENMSIAITGVRGAGKTYRTYQYIDSLLIAS